MHILSGVCELILCGADELGYFDFLSLLLFDHT